MRCLSFFMRLTAFAIWTAFSFLLFFQAAGVSALETSPGPVRPEITLTEEERAWLRAHPEIRLGYIDSHEPQVIVNPDGTYSGIVVDLLNELNRRLRTAIRLEVYTLDKLLDKAKSSEIDGIFNLHPEYADRLGMLKSRGYLLNYPTVFGRREIVFKGPDDFTGKKVAIIDKTYFSEKIILQHADRIAVLKVDDALEGLESLQRGQADLFLGVSHNSYLISKYQLFDILSKYIYSDYPDRVVMAVRSDWPMLVNILDKGLATFSDFDLNIMVAKWIQPPPQKEITELTGEERAWLEEDHTVRVRVTDRAPTIYSVNGEPLGIAVDLLGEVSKHTGIRFQYVIPSPPFPEDYRGLVQHTGPDIIPALQPAPEREKEVLFTEVYVSTPRFIFIRDDSPFIDSLDGLSGETVAVVTDYLVHDWLAGDYPDINLLLCKNNREALEAVSSGKAFAYIGPLRTTSFSINEFGLTNLKAAAPASLPKNETAMGIRSDWPELRDMINKVFASIPVAEKAAIISEWSPVKFQPGIRPAEVLKWVVLVGGVALGILLWFVTWNRSLKKQVSRRTSDLAAANLSLEAEIEERRKAEETLRYQARLLENVSDAVISVGMDYRVQSWNEAAEKIYGWHFEEVHGKSLREFTALEYPYDSREDVLAQVHRNGFWRGEVVQKRKDGKEIFVHTSTSLVKDDEGNPSGIVGVMRDITEQKKTEEKIRRYQERLRELALELTVAEERERRRIAEEMHDRVGQALTLARVQLATARMSLVDTGTNSSLDEISESLLQAIRDTRELIFDLSPPMLSEVGFEAAVSEWLKEQIGKKHEIETEFISDGRQMNFDDNIKAILFRNVRELLTNVVKHAEAERVSVRLDRAAPGFRIIVEDDGRGFDPRIMSSAALEEGGFGLFSIRERMEDFGGTMEIVSAPGHGCRVILTVPLEEQ